MKKLLLVSIGTNQNNLQKSDINNLNNPTILSSNHLNASILVRIKNFNSNNLIYFHNRIRLFSMQISCQFKKVIPFSIGLAVANLIDPGLKADLYSDKPWLQSPILCAMNIVSVTHPPHPYNFNTTQKELLEDTKLLTNHPLKSASDRRAYFLNSNLSKNIHFNPDHVYHFDFFGPSIDFNTFQLSLGIHIDITRYLNHQPVRFMAKSKSLDTTLFVIEFKLVEE
ncbi:hypothetical protein BC833DRAFT_589183 [Globomyces pollinis-pini]|nr:hypothetical protein BC833DRAFT_589183 [Globomyces pollinis-pini]